MSAQDDTPQTAAVLIMGIKMNRQKMTKRTVKDHELQQLEAVETDNPPIVDGIHHLVDYVADLERNTKWLSNRKSRDEATLELLSLARVIERFHQIKAKNLGEELTALGEPVWKILIQLVIATDEERNISVADIFRRISLPETIALRYLNILESKGYIFWSARQDGHYVNQLQLTKQGQSIMRDTLSVLNAV